MVPIYRCKWIANEDGEVVSDKLDVGPEGYAILPAAPSGTYMVELMEALGSGGAGHWGFLHFIARSDSYVHDPESEPNDQPLDADTITMEEYENSGGNLFQRGQADGIIDEAMDADLFAFSADYEQTYLCACINSAEYGSAVVPNFEVLNSDGELVQYDDGSGTLQDAVYTGAAGQDPDTIIENLELSVGSYFLKVVDDAKSEGGPGSWYRFNLFLASFEVSAYASGGFSCP